MSNIVPANLSPADKEYIFFSDPGLLDKICDHVSNGGTVIDMAKVSNIQYSKIMKWIRFDADRLRKYQEALEDRREWAKESVLNEIRSLGMFDIRKLLGPDGEVLPPDQWPDDVAKAVVGLDVSEEKSEGVPIGLLKKIKTVDKLKSLEMVAKNLKLLTETHDHKHEVTLDQLIMRTQDKKDEIK